MLSCAPTSTSHQLLTLHIYDHATLSYLEAVNKIFEKGLLSHDKVTDGDDEIFASISEGLEYFIEWCDKAIENGNNHVTTDTISTHSIHLVMQIILINAHPSCRC